MIFFRHWVTFFLALKNSFDGCSEPLSKAVEQIVKYLLECCQVAISISSVVTESNVVREKPF